MVSSVGLNNIFLKVRIGKNESVEVRTDGLIQFKHLTCFSQVNFIKDNTGMCLNNSRDHEY